VTLHTLLAQSLLELHALPPAQGPHVPPPQSTADSCPFFTPSVHVAAWHTLLEHTTLAQSPATLHGSPGPQPGQLPPPQSMLVSAPFLTPSLHAGA
jgi:hypothetical protein